MKRFICSFIGAALCVAAYSQASVQPQKARIFASDKTPMSTILPSLNAAKAGEANCDVEVTFPKPVPTFLPLNLINGMPIETQVTNLGSETVSGTVTLSIGDATIGTADFTDLASGANANLTIEISTEIDAPAKKQTLTATAEITGKEDENPDNNSASTTITISENEFAYDHTTPSMYVDDNALGLPDFGSILVANTFHISNPVVLDSVSAAWGRIEGDKIGIYIWKWDAQSAPNENGYYNLDEQIYFGTHNQGLQRGMHYYKLEEPIYLASGDYMLGISFYGYGIAVDQITPGQMYNVFAETDGYRASDWSSYGFGTAAIRMYVSDVPASINTITTSDNQAGASVNVNGNKLYVTGDASEISSVSIYSASGANMAAAEVNGHDYSHDLSSFTPGVYMVKVTTKSGTCVRKFAVK